MTDRSIYPPEDATIFAHREGGKYRPSNGFEGEIFYEAWCADCAREAAFRADPALGEGCPILAAAMSVDIAHPDYPNAWQYGPSGQPCCTSHITEGLIDRCPVTPDLFGE